MTAVLFSCFRLKGANHMKEGRISLLLFLTGIASLMLVSCQNLVGRTASSDQAETSSSVASSATSGSVSAVLSASSSETVNYSSYSGSWVQKGVTSIDVSGGVTLTIKIDQSNTATGQISALTANAGRVDTAGFSGKVENGELSAHFEDSFENSGTIHLQIQDCEITEYVELDNRPQGMSLNTNPIRLLKQ